MISIITAVHNQLDMNKLFLASIQRYTFYPYELIVIDNNSTDGSANFFEQNGAKVIRNNANYSYPFCQNQGIKEAKFDTYAFLNNDIIVSPQWDKRLLDAMQQQHLDVLTVCGIERIETAEATKKLGRRWKRIKNTINAIGGINASTLKLMHYLMYGNWERFNLKRETDFKGKVVEGFVGNSVLFNKNAVAKIGLWDERIQEADFDLYIRSKKRAIDVGDIKPCHIALNVFHHHYIRMTAKSKPPVFADAGNMIPLAKKWTDSEREVYLKDNLAT